MEKNASTLTERGQVSLPAGIRKEMGLRPGQVIRWEKVTANEGRFFVEKEKPAGLRSVLGYGRKIWGEKVRRTSDWMKELRDGEA